ncbi:hypothetical protein [Methylobacterium trifolii]|uniref:Uncharacterized protein n=1 Tax=Methylobacterium trifolii TaxID=1003092 RepID=A0ABQ4U4L8_9HYPH|nr:hypothetical protein [Methylobacterium trifolii]GJE61782.1 hypothetical protein MPOCJGCO_3908 [Methylobacterium trifolii]
MTERSPRLPGLRRSDTTDLQSQAMAREILAASDARAQIAPPTDADPAFDTASA